MQLFLEDLALRLRLEGWVAFGHANVKEWAEER
jgi:hypothetical protein